MAAAPHGAADMMAAEDWVRWQRQRLRRARRVATPSPGPPSMHAAQTTVILPTMPELQRFGQRPQEFQSIGIGNCYQGELT